MRQSRGFNFNKSSLVREGFASVRSTLAGVAETGSETAQRLEGFASVRSTLAGLAERGSETAKRLESKKKQSLTACGGAPFTQGSLKTSRQPKFLLPTFLFKEKYGAYFSFQRKVRSKKVRGVYINRYKKGRKGDCGWRIGAAHSAKQKVSVQTPSLCPKIY